MRAIELAIINILLIDLLKRNAAAPGRMSIAVTKITPLDLTEATIVKHRLVSKRR